MKNIKNYTDFLNENTLNEEFNLYKIEMFVKGIISLPLVFLMYFILNLLNVRFLMRSMGRNGYESIDIYNNIDKLILALDNALNDDSINLTNREKNKVKYFIEKLNKLIKKYPTIDDFKKKFAKKVSYLNIKDARFVKKEIMDYQPKELDLHDILKYIRKQFKFVKNNHFLDKDKIDQMKEIDPLGEEDWNDYPINNRSPFYYHG